MSNIEQRKSETISRGEYETAHSSVELKEMSGGSTEEQVCISFLSLLYF